MVNIEYQDWETKIDLPYLAQWLSEVCKTEKKELQEITIIYCSDQYLLEVNQKHLNHDYFTDIITFDYCVDNQVFGDLFISVDRVKDNAEQHKVDWKKELARIVVHGVLHLCGYGDKSPSEKELMTTKEDLYLSLRP